MQKVGKKLYLAFVMCAAIALALAFAIAFLPHKTSARAVTVISDKDILQSYVQDNDNVDIVLGEDMELTAPLAVDAKTIRLDLTGHILSLKSGVTDSVINITNGAKLTIKDSLSTNPHANFTVKNPIDNTNVSITGGIITGGKSSGIYVENSTLTVEGGTIAGNVADLGGGIFATNSTVRLYGGAVSYNQARQFGGGIRLNGSRLFIGSSSQITNESDKDSTCEISYNMAADAAGAIDEAAASESAIYMNGGKITRNNAKKNYGGVCVEKLSTMTIFKGEISYNTVGTATKLEGNGGGIGVISTVENGLTIHDATIKGNSAYRGGGLYIGCGDGYEKGASAIIHGGTIGTTATDTATVANEKNTAYVGGGICVQDASLTLADGTIAGNTADYGGGVRVESSKKTENPVTYKDSSFVMNGGSISYNTATKDGGGLCVCQATEIKLNGGKIENNASTAGGGIYFEGTGKNAQDKIIFVFDGVTVQGNTVTIDPNPLNPNNDYSGQGGGVYVDGSAVELKSGEIKNNTTSKNGGGIIVTGELVMSGGTISGNNAQNGGGVSVNDGSFTMPGGNITGNKSYNGGGVMVSGTFTLIGGTIGNNIATNKGGGVYVGARTFTMANGTLSQNEANFGGGVYVSSGATFSMGGGTITKNKAKATNSFDNGGGVYVAGTSSLVGMFNMSGTAAVTENEATKNGGGVYINGTFTVQGAVKITGNTAGLSYPDVMLALGKVITVAGALTKDDKNAEIDVTQIINQENDNICLSSVFTSGYKTFNETVKPSVYFKDRNTAKYCAQLDGNEVKIAAHKKVTDAAVEETCTTAGKTEGSHCSACGYVIKAQTTIDATGHDPASTWSSDASGHYHECENGCGTKLDSAAHTAVPDAAVAATCTTDGKTAGSHCSICNYVITAQTTVNILGHDLVHHDAQAATCTAIGWNAYDTCSRCTHSTYAEISALGHTEVSDDNAVAATCTEAGKTASKHCTRCNTVTVAQTTVAVLGHDWADDFTTDTPATCTTVGSKSKHCSRCDAKNDVTEIPFAAHTLTHVDCVEATTEANGNIEYWSCSVCQYYFSDGQGATVITDKASVTIPKLTPTPDDPTPDDSENNGGGTTEPNFGDGGGNPHKLSGGAIAGIVIAAVVFVLLASYVGGYFALYRRGKVFKGRVWDVVYKPFDAIGKKKDE